MLQHGLKGRAMGYFLHFDITLRKKGGDMVCMYTGK